MNLLQAIEEVNNHTQTWNGMEAYTSTLNPCLDMFYQAGASRNIDEQEIKRLFVSAFTQDQEVTIGLLLWSRDVRGGAGERRFFRICMETLFQINPNVFRKVLPFVAEYGRWDDLFWLFEKTNEYEIVVITAEALSRDNGLCAKWLERKPKRYPKLYKNMLHFFGITPKIYRKRLVEKTHVVETKMCENSWSDIEYSTVPSIAFKNYRQAFMRHDETRFEKFLDKAISGDEKVNASAIFPNDIISPLLGYGVCQDNNIHKSIIAQWKNLPNYMDGCDENILVVCDTSGSMYGKPIEVAVSLAIYFSERLKGNFKDNFITFSEKPALQKLSGNIVEKCLQLKKADWDMNTNLEAVFNLILNSAKTHSVSSNDMPTKVLIISDMQFDNAVTHKNNAFDMIEQQYEEAGYKLPQLMFWNVNGEAGNIPVTFAQKGTALLSGFSPSTIDSVLHGEVLTPVESMLYTIRKPRYLDTLKIIFNKGETNGV